jgi:hypothetical protein
MIITLTSEGVQGWSYSTRTMRMERWSKVNKAGAKIPALSIRPVSTLHYRGDTVDKHQQNFVKTESDITSTFICDV